LSLTATAAAAADITTVAATLFNESIFIISRDYSWLSWEPSRLPKQDFYRLVTVSVAQSVVSVKSLKVII